MTSATELAQALQARQVSSEEVLAETFAAIDRREEEVGAFISFADRDELIAQAREIDNRRARGESVPEFAGVPIAVKDNISVAGLRCTCGSRILENYVAPYDATSVARVRAAGLLIVGKTNMDEFGFGSSTENSAFHPTRNPHSLDRVPGGTSGGSAAAVAAGFVPWALGTDTGGSVRQPAALCGVVGMRPTYGRVSRYGLVAYASSMDQVGPLANTVEDAAALLSLTMGPDPYDGTALPEPAPDPLLTPVSERTLRIGIPEQYVDPSCQEEVLQAVEEASRVAGKLGWQVSSVSLPLTDHALSIYYLIASVEAASNLARYDGVRYGRRVAARSWESMVAQTRTEGFGAEAKRRIMLGTFAASAGYQDQFYLQACRARRALAAEFAAVFADVDLLLSPVSPTTAWRIGEKVADPMKMYLSDVFSVPVALAGLPAAVVPAGRDAQGLPVGVQLCGAVRGDSLVLSAARELAHALTTGV